MADLIPDEMVATWARTALDRASARFAAAMGARVYVNAYDALEGLANRFPDELVAELLAEIGLRLPNDYGLLGDQIAGILVGLGRHSPGHHGAVADLIAVAFEDADDVAYTILNAARSLTAPLTVVQDRLRALLAPGAGVGSCRRPIPGDRCLRAGRGRQAASRPPYQRAAHHSW